MTYPIVKELKADRTQKFVDRNDPNFDKPLSELNIDYELAYLSNEKNRVRTLYLDGIKIN